MTGAVGTQAAMGEKGMAVQEKMMEYLGIGCVDVSNQVIQRDRYAEYFCFLANLATTLDKIGIEIRSMQRTEIGEVEEAFGSKQVGSSTMPHKRNPIRSEQVCGLARIVRSAVEPAFQNNTLWDERDLTNSSPERILFPEASILCDHIIRLMTTVIEGLVIREDRIQENLNLLHGINMAESVMIELTRRGMGRQEAHEIIRVKSMEALSAKRSLASLLSDTPEVTGRIPPAEIEHLLDPEHYLGTSVLQVERVVSKLRPLCV
jgi:adenylosuccinate lyase